MDSKLGKKFENVVKECFLKVPEVDVTRLYDSMQGNLGVSNPSDFIVYKYPHIYYVECKTTRTNTLNLNSIRQLLQLKEKYKISGVKSGLIIWYYQHQETYWVESGYIEYLETVGKKSINIKDLRDAVVLTVVGVKLIPCKVKRVFCEYDFSTFFEE